MKTFMVVRFSVCVWDLFVSSKKREKQIMMMGSVSDFGKRCQGKDTIALQLAVTGDQNQSN